jgi:hypothetical protein
MFRSGMMGLLIEQCRSNQQCTTAQTVSQKQMHDTGQNNRTINERRKFNMKTFCVPKQENINVTDEVVTTRKT